MATKKKPSDDTAYLLEKARLLLDKTNKTTKEVKKKQTACACGKKPIYMKGQCKDCYEEQRNLKEEAALGRKWESTDGYWRVYGPGMKVMLYSTYRAQEILGRELEKHEYISYVDGNKSNIEDDNLMLCSRKGVPLSIIRQSIEQESLLLLPNLSPQQQQCPTHQDRSDCTSECG